MPPECGGLIGESAGGPAAFSGHFTFQPENGPPVTLR
jgi:hypothetical protein